MDYRPPSPPTEKPSANLVDDCELSLDAAIPHEPDRKVEAKMVQLNMAQSTMKSDFQAEWQQSWGRLQEALEAHRLHQEQLLLRAADAVAASAMASRAAPFTKEVAFVEPSPQPEKPDIPCLNETEIDPGMVLKAAKKRPRSTSSPRISKKSSTDTRTWQRRALASEITQRLDDFSRRPEKAESVMGRAEQRGLRLAKRLVDLREPARTGPLSRLIVSTPWQFLISLAIAASAILMMEAVDYKIQHLDEELPSGYKTAETGLSLLFGVEVLLRLSVHRLFYFCNDNWRWNIFDLLLVLQSIYDGFSDLAEESGQGNVSFLRTLRLLRFVRALRVVRMLQFAAPLRRMALSLMGSAASLFWSLVMLVFVLSLLGLVMMQFVTAGLTSATIDDLERKEVLWHFGSVLKTVLSFYMASTGGENWVIYFELLLKVAWEAAALMVFVVAFMTIAMLNILTGMFVETALKLAEPDQETLALERRREQFQQAQEFEALLRKIDIDCSGTISREEFRKICGDSRVNTALAVMGLEVRDADLVFEVLQSECNVDEVDHGFLLDACMKMKGAATSLEVQTLSYRLLLLNERLEELDRRVSANGSSSRPLSANAEQAVAEAPYTL